MNSHQNKPRYLPLEPSRIDAAPAIRLPRSAIDAVLARRRLDEVLLVVGEEGIEVDTRDSRAACLRMAGCYELARKIKRAIVPPKSVLVYADFERGTALLTLPIVELVENAFDDAPVEPVALWKAAS